jgi:RNA polymerase sigma-70 factor (ECF subfamily)
MSSLTILPFVQRLLAELPSLLRVARRLTRSEADAEDLVQATIERAFERRGDLREQGKLRAWLLQVQRSVLLNTTRGLRNRLEVLEGGQGGKAPTEPTGNLEAEILERSFADDVQRALDGLPLEWREVLLLREVEELSYEEIAQVLGCPVGTVRSRLARARAAFLEQLSEQRGESWQDATKSGSRTYRRGTTVR